MTGIKTRPLKLKSEDLEVRLCRLEAGGGGE